MMKKLSGIVLFSLLILTWCPTAFAFPNEHYFWDRWNDYEQHHRPDHDRRAPNIAFFHDREDGNWYGHHRFDNIRIEYSDNHHRHMLRASYENDNGWKLLAAMKKSHGDFTYRGSSDDGNPAFYWIGHDTIIRAVIGDNGHLYTSVWYRSEAERLAVRTGRVNPEQLARFARFDDMPSAVAQKYIAIVLRD